MVTAQNMYFHYYLEDRKVANACTAGRVLDQFPGLPEPFSHSKDLSSVVPFHFY